ncbi:hypothetical protein [Pseudoalteromonas piscicida]|uniref:hypothetical protein n=1 Tax=Pseudoalteromonas piscicida TaxID=43662 RepID=UPI0030A8F155
MKIKSIVLLLAGITATGCSTLTPDQQEKLDDMSGCEKLDALLNASSTGFAVLKGAEVGSNLINSWQAKAHLVGNKCQIIEGTSGKTKYTCQEQFKDYQGAVKIHIYAQSLAKQCLDANWVATEKENGESMHTQLVSPNSTAVIGIELGQSLDKVAPWLVTFNVSNK